MIIRIVILELTVRLLGNRSVLESYLQISRTSQENKQQQLAIQGLQPQTPPHPPSGIRSVPHPLKPQSEEIEKTAALPQFSPRGWWACNQKESEAKSSPI